MERFKVRLSLRYKLLLILTSLPLASLALYLLMATQLFEKDKIAYVFDASAAVSRSLATQIRSEYGSFLTAVKPIVEAYDYDAGDFSVLSKDLFQKQSKVQALVLHQGNPELQYQRLGVLSVAGRESEEFVADDRTIEQLRDVASARGANIIGYPLAPQSVAVSYRLGEVDKPSHLVMIALFKSEDLVRAFRKSTLYQSLLLSKQGKLSLGPEELSGTVLEGEDYSVFLKPVLAAETPEGTAEITNSKGRDTLVSYADVGLGGLIVSSVVDKRAALKAVEVLVSKSILFFVALISSTVIISLFASIKLTTTLRELYEATKKIAQGQFDVRVHSRSQDEFGGLAESFNWMAGEVSRLMANTAEKARLENELNTVRAVQETLFPSNHSQFGLVDVVGHYEPATECGGDWWNYTLIGDKIYLWIGDATGHGAPAALITSAARSAAAVIESMPSLTPGKALEIMNYAIHETSKGKIMMTFFLGCLDVKTGVLLYANASHDPPYLIRLPKGEKLSKKDLLPLMDVNGARLGDKKDSKYEEAQVLLQPGETILLYTDGIVDLQNPEGVKWGERTFIKTVLESVQNGKTVEEKMNGLRDKVHAYRQGSVLIDDITLFMCHYKDKAVA